MEEINTKAQFDELNKDEHEFSNKFDRKTAERVKARLKKAQAQQEGETFEK